MAEQGYPYHITETVTISGFHSASGKKWNLSPNTFMFRNVVIHELVGENHDSTGAGN